MMKLDINKFLHVIVSQHFYEVNVNVGNALDVYRSVIYNNYIELRYNVIRYSVIQCSVIRCNEFQGNRFDMN